MTELEQDFQPYEGVSTDYYTTHTAPAVAWSDEVEENGDELVFEVDKQYWSAIWGNGYVEIVDHQLEPTREKLTGFAIPSVIGMKTEIKMPLDLRKVMDKLVSTKKARLVTAKHDDGKIKSYYLLTDNSYAMYPLILGLPKIGKWDNNIISKDCYRLDGPMPDARNLLGAVCGRETNVDTQKLKQTTSNFLVFLLVIDSLWEAGYVDQDGVPIPIRFKSSGLAKDELAGALQKHVGMVARARELDPKKFQYAEPWQFGMYMRHNEKPVKHTNKLGKQSDAFQVAVQMPEVVGLEYINKMYLGDTKKRNLIRRLVREPYYTEEGKLLTRPGGEAINWGRSMAVFNINQQRRLNPTSDKFPNGECVFGKNQDLTTRIMRSLAQQTSQQAARVEEEHDRPKARPTFAPVVIEETINGGEEPDYYSQLADTIARLEMANLKPQATALGIVLEKLENGEYGEEDEQTIIDALNEAKGALPKKKPFARRPMTQQ